MEETFKSYRHISSDEMSESAKLDNNQCKVIDDGSQIKLWCTAKESFVKLEEQRGHGDILR